MIIHQSPVVRVLVILNGSTHTQNRTVPNSFEGTTERDEKSRDSSIKKGKGVFDDYIHPSSGIAIEFSTTFKVNKSNTTQRSLGSPLLSRRAVRVRDWK